MLEEARDLSWNVCLLAILAQTLAYVLVLRREMEDQNCFPRPLWLPHPVLSLMNPSEEAGLSVILVSVGIGKQFKDGLDVLSTTSAVMGFNRTLLWNDSALFDDPLFARFRGAFGNLQEENLNRSDQFWGMKQRPFCAAFKPIILLRAMRSARKGDYIMWADSTMYKQVHIRYAPHFNIHFAIMRVVQKSKLYKKVCSACHVPTEIGWRGT